MLAVFLVLVAAVAIAWPFLKERGWIPEPVLALPEKIKSRLPQRPVAEDAAAVEIPVGSQRESLCPYCSRLNPPHTSHCVDCGNLLPVENLSSLWRGEEKNRIIQEGIQIGAILLLIIAAMVISNNLATSGKITILMLTVGALSYRVFRFIQG
jgi:hypothetical protein